MEECEHKYIIWDSIGKLFISGYQIVGECQACRKRVWTIANFRYEHPPLLVEEEEKKSGQ